jgi:hypothetical protein
VNQIGQIPQIFHPPIQTDGLAGPPHQSLFFRGGRIRLQTTFFKSRHMNDHATAFGITRLCYGLDPIGGPDHALGSRPGALASGFFARRGFARGRSRMERK